MVHLFHGDNFPASRHGFNEFIAQHPNFEILRSDKDTDPQNIMMFIGGQSLYSTQKLLAISNFFSLPKATQDKLAKVINANPDTPFAVWQDKKLTLVQIKIFPQAKSQIFNLSNQLYACLDAIKPHHTADFVKLYHQLDLDGIYDLFLYLIKGQFRRQLTGYSPFSASILQQSYLQLIELDYQNKTGQLPLPKHIALERIITNIIK